MTTRRGPAFLCAVACAIAFLWSCRAAPVEEKREPVSRTLIIDPSGFLPAADLPRFDEYLTAIHDESDVDIRMAFDRPPAGKDLNAAALELVERLGVGGRTHAQRGLLLYFDIAARRLKVEVGYGLEAYFPDSYIAFLVERHAPLFFEAGDRSVGLRLLLRLLQARIRDAVLGGDFDPTPYRQSAAHLSGGAGSTSDLNDRSRATLSRSAPPTHLAGATPNDTCVAYLDLMSAADWEPGSDVFTADSRVYLKSFPMSRAYRDFIVMGEYGKSSKVEARGDYALLYFTGTPLVTPHFFIRQGGVWRLDIVSEVRDTKEYVGGPFTWSFEGRGDAYSTTFADLLTEVEGYRRIAPGDNRPLPTSVKRGRPSR